MSANKRTAWVVKTPEGFLGKRHYSYREGTTSSKQTSLKFARVFTREADARKSCERGDTVLPVTITVKIRETPTRKWLSLLRSPRAPSFGPS